MSHGFLKGALIGGAIAGIAGLLVAPKPGSKLIEDILEIYNNAQESGHDFVDAIKEKGSCIAGFCKNGFCEEEECDYHSSLLMGLIVGALVSGVTALLLAPQSGKKMRKILGDQYDDIRERAEDFVSSVEKKGGKILHEASDWKDSLSDLVSKLSKTGHKASRHSSVNDFIDLAKLGLNFYQQLQSRR